MTRPILILFVFLGIATILFLSGSSWGSSESFSSLPSLHEIERDQVKTASAYEKAFREGAPPMTLLLLKASRARAHAASTIFFTDKALADPSVPAEVKIHASEARKSYARAVRAEMDAQKAASLSDRAAAAEGAYRAFVDTLDHGLSVTMFTDPVRPVVLPPLAPGAPECGATLRVTGPPKVPSFDRSRPTPKQQRLLDYLVAKGKEFLAHVSAAYPADPRVQKLKGWARVVLGFSQRREDESSTWALAETYTGCIVFSLDRMGSVPRSLTRLLHEMSHLASKENGHTAKFYECHRWFMTIASEELGWTLENRCRETCDMTPEARASACPKCTWQVPPGECAPRPKECRPKDR